MAALITLLYAVGGFALASRSLGDNSFLWHLRTGGLILDHGIPRRDPVLVHRAGTHWIAQSWLAELMYGALDALGRRRRHPASSSASRACASRCSCSASRSARRTTASARSRIGIPALACSFTVWSERPLMFGLALLGVLVFTVEVPESFLGRHRVIVVPVVMWLWVNVHGTFSLGFAVPRGAPRRAAGSTARGRGQGRERELLDRRPRSPPCSCS